jgi:hypothetical protein
MWRLIRLEMEENAAICSPSTLFANGATVLSIEFHGHGTASSEEVAADKIGQKNAEVQFQGFSCGLGRGRQRGEF